MQPIRKRSLRVACGNMTSREEIQESLFHEKAESFSTKGTMFVDYKSLLETIFKVPRLRVESGKEGTFR